MKRKKNIGLKLTKIIVWEKNIYSLEIKNQCIVNLRKYIKRKKKIIW